MTGLSKKRRKKLQEKIDTFGYRNYEDDDVVVREVGPCGVGVFAARQFTPGQLVIEARGQVLRQSEYEGSTYTMELDEKLYIEPSIPAAFVNHSCNPNTELVKISKHTLGFIALCNIEEDSQVTFDYGWIAQDWVPQCQCGSVNCRGWVVAADEVEKMKKIVAKMKRKKQKRKRKK